MRKLNYCRAFVVVYLTGLLGILPSLVAGTTLEVESEVQLSTDFGGRPIPVWAGGSLVCVERTGTSTILVSIVDRAGQLIGTTGIDIPGADYVTITSFDRGQDGTVAFTGGSATRDGKSASFVGWLSPEDQRPQIVRTSPYRPFSVAVGSDGSVWTVGSEPKPRDAWIANSTARSKLEPNAASIRRFDRDGRLIGSFLPQSEIQEPLALHSTTSLFGAAGEGVVWYSGEEGAWIEVGPTGVVRRIRGVQLPDQERQTGFAITEGGAIFASSMGSTSSSILKFDSDLGQWESVEHVEFGAGPAQATVLYGADGNRLVAWKPGAINRFQFLATVSE